MRIIAQLLTPGPLVSVVFTPALKRVVAGLVFLGAMAAPAKAQLVTEYTWTGLEATMDERLFRDGELSNWQNPKAFPGTAAGTFSWVAFEFANPTGIDTPFFVDILQSTALNSFFSVYSGGFNPDDQAAGYLGDAGFSFNSPVSGPQTFSVLVSGGTSAWVMLSTGQSNKTFADETVIFQTTFENASVVPEPGTMLLLGTGLASLAFIGRRRRTRHVL